MKGGALFAGYAGLELAVSQVLDVETAWVSEFDAAPSKILAAHFPDAPNFGDVTAVDWATVEPVDVLTGGFPCQDVSTAGMRRGLRDGTRSGLWYEMARAIKTLRPGLVVIENVRGLLSAESDGYVEPCPWCLGEAGDGEPAVRALGTLLADLAELGYDAAWTGLRAADVGAPHGRFRVFVLAWDASEAGMRAAQGAASRPGVRTGVRATDGLPLFRTPTSQLAINGGSQHPDKRKAGGHGPTLADEVEHLLPTPQAMDTAGAMADRRSTSGYGPALRDITALLPTPRAEERMQCNSRDAGMSLSATTALLPTPAVNDMGASYDIEKWDAWTARMKAAHGNGNGHGNSLHIEALRMLPTPTTTQRGTDESAVDRADAGPNLHNAVRDFGQYAPAIAAWEAALGRPAPAPTEPTGKGGAHRLSPRFVEWLMGLPDGWVTDTDTTRNEQLKALGNGVVPQQAAAAVRHLLTVREWAITREAVA